MNGPGNEDLLRSFLKLKQVKINFNLTICLGQIFLKKHSDKYRCDLPLESVPGTPKIRIRICMDPHSDSDPLQNEGPKRVCKANTLILEKGNF